MTTPTFGYSINSAPVPIAGGTTLDVTFFENLAADVGPGETRHEQIVVWTVGATDDAGVEAAIESSVRAWVGARRDARGMAAAVPLLAASIGQDVILAEV